MKNILSRTILFIKENPSILYSLVLIGIIPAAFFFNTYRINSSYESDIDKITQRKAILAENIINNLIESKLGEKTAIQIQVEKIMKKNEEINSIIIMEPDSTQEGFRVIASNKTELVDQIQTGNIQNLIAWNRPEGVAFLDRNENGRFWSVTKSLLDESQKKIGLISMEFSLKDSDALIQRTIHNSYWIVIVTILVVVLMVANQARLFGYALTLSKLKEIDKMKDMFISMASHELRSPLTAIKGYIELIKEKKEVQADQESKHYVENISLSAERLHTLVNDILDVSRLEGNSLPIEITQFDPNPVITQTIEELKSQAIQKGLEIKYSPSESTVQVKADVNRTKQILVNLIGNAIKYTPKGSVEITTGLKEGKFSVTVADTGMGISSENQKKLFQKFYRVQNENTKTIVGTGLGLWITLEIAKRMKGDITVESIEGVGSHFTLHLPVKKG